MSNLQIRKVSVMPVTYQPSTMYLVGAAGAELDIYVSTADGTSIKNIVTRSEITALIAAAIGTASSIDVVANIPARDALVPTANTQVLVLDATADGTVLLGAATYIYNFVTTTWYKVSEYESMDLVNDWANIINGPTSVVADIDNAVSLRHTHANKTVLDSMNNVSGELVFLGNGIRARLDEEIW